MHESVSDDVNALFLKYLEKSSRGNCISFLPNASSRKERDRDGEKREGRGERECECASVFLKGTTGLNIDEVERQIHRVHWTGVRQKNRADSWPNRKCPGLLTQHLFWAPRASSSNWHEWIRLHANETAIKDVSLPDSVAAGSWRRPATREEGICIKYSERSMGMAGSRLDKQFNKHPGRMSLTFIKLEVTDEKRDGRPCLGNDDLSDLETFHSAEALARWRRGKQEVWNLSETAWHIFFSGPGIKWAWSSFQKIIPLKVHLVFWTKWTIDRHYLSNC